MAKRRGKKIKDTGQTISQPDANTKVVRPAPVSRSDSSQPHALLGKRKAKNKLGGLLSGFIFMCNVKTKPECFRYRVFGLPSGRKEDVEKVKKGMKLFLFDFDVKLLYGVYKATSHGQMNLEPSSFGGKFPAQVSFAIHKECLPLPETAFRSAIKDNYDGSKFKPELTQQQVRDLLLLFRPCAALTAAAPAASTPQVAPPQAIRPPALEDSFQPSVMLPPSQDPYLAGVQHGYGAPIVEPHLVQQRVLNDPYYVAENRRPYLAEDTSRITQDPYPRYGTVQKMVPRDQYANIAAGYYNTYPMPATSHGPQLMHHPREDREYVPQRENVAGYYATYPMPATSHGPPLVHHPHEEREYVLQQENVAGYYATYPVPATSHGPPLVHHPHGGREYDLQRDKVAGYYATHPHGLVPGRPKLPVGNVPVSSSHSFDGATKQVYR